jgi:16S rRNA (guanine966-N2)-methyltransferase
MLRINTGQFKGKHLKLPPESITRPSSDRLRQAIFNILVNTLCFKGLHVLDGFAGSGALGLEALSRGAAEVVFCESNPLVQKILKENILNTVKAGHAHVTITNDFFQLKAVHPFDLVFLDPPYDKGLEIQALEFLLCNKLISSNGVIIMEQRKGAAALVCADFTIQEPRVYGKCQITFLQLTS